MWVCCGWYFSGYCTPRVGIEVKGPLLLRHKWERGAPQGVGVGDREGGPDVACLVWKK